VIEALGASKLPLSTYSNRNFMNSMNLLSVETTAAAGFLIVGYLAAIKVMRVGDLAVVAPFRYTSLLFAILLGWARFGTLPDHLTLIGGAIVVASGVYMLMHERRR
jgi:drug/metabolite transporter (DMT)-like permease